MPIVKTTEVKLQFEGKKAYWKLDSTEIIDIGGEEFIKLPKTGVQSGFTRLVT